MVLWISLVSAQAAPAAKPRLVVVIVVDQLRSDYLPRFEHLFVPARQKNGAVGGFRYLMEQGAYFKNAQFDHTQMVTGIGHATILTGAYPYLHGLVGNSWYEREREKKVNVVFDETATLVGSAKKTGEDGRSPHHLLVTTLGDEMKNAWGGKSLVGGIALKDRSAILLAGHRADLALWTEKDSPNFVTSTYYAKDGKLPGWVERWNKSDYMAKKAPKVWNKLLPEKDYWLSTPLPPETVAFLKGLTKTFPHPITDVNSFAASPYGNAYTLDAAVEMIKQMKFGADTVPDLLGVSLSSFDMLGHNFGFISAEMQDMTVRLDQQLADFFNDLDKKIPGGLKNVVIVLTADHGVPMNHAMAERFNLPGGVYWGETVTAKADAYLRTKFGFSSSEKPIVAFNESQITLDEKLITKRGKDLNQIARELARWLRMQNFVAAAHAKIDLLEGQVPPTSLARRMALSIHAGRSGDVLFVARPGFAQLPDGKNVGVDHETAFVQEASVPLILAGPWFKPGKYFENVMINDLAPSLSLALGITAPSGSEGRALVKALAP